MDTKQLNTVEALLSKALDTLDAVKAVHFTQAACNAANALSVLDNIKRQNNP